MIRLMGLGDPYRCSTESTLHPLIVLFSRIECSTFSLLTSAVATLPLSPTLSCPKLHIMDTTRYLVSFSSQLLALIV